MKTRTYLGIAGMIVAGTVVAFGQQSLYSRADRVEVAISGGYDTDPRDHGRPVLLIASALGVPADVFREAFSHVRPAPAGTEPDPRQVQLNKQALLNALGRYGITNERLDEVSNYYRYNPGRGEMWLTTEAKAYATLSKGVITGFVVTDPGSGYSSTPIFSIPGRGRLSVSVLMSYDRDMRKNGRISQINLAK
jgi:hypothetical protein